MDGSNAFVVHEHHARSLHWDLRLERDGVLVSWAVPKGMPTDPKVNRLAVHVEDHALEYGTFEGRIGDDAHGAGQVSIWDSGTYTTEKWTTREVKFVLHGQRTSGRFVLFQTDGDNWMLHRMDTPATPGWVALPQRTKPMLATPGAMPIDQERWAFEIRWDGLRALIRVEGGRGAVMSATGSAITSTFPELRGLGEHLGTTQALLDGVIVRFDHTARPDRDSVTRRLAEASTTRIRSSAQAEPVTFIAFDLLHLDGRPLLELAYRRRRDALVRLELAATAWQTPPAFDGTGAAARQTSRDNGFAGIVAKRLDSPYRPGERSPDWISVTG